MRKLNFLSVAALCALAGCGGGSGGGSTPPPPPPPPSASAEDLANARSSAMAMVYSPGQSALEISWTDSFSAELGYRVEKQSSGSAWQAVETLPATSSTGQTVSWKGALSQSATYRVVAMKDGYVVPLEAAPGVTTGSIDPASPAMTIEHDQLEPLRTAARFSIANAPAAATQVRWFIDNPPQPGAPGTTIGTFTNAPTFVTPPQNLLIPIGAHTIYAYVTVATGVEIRVQRVVDSVDPQKYWQYSTEIDGADVLHVKVISGQSVGVTTAHIFINGTEIPATFENVVYGQWHATFDVSGLPISSAALRLVLTLTTGESVDVTRSVAIDRTPKLAVDSPVDGAIVKGTMQLKASVTDDGPTATTTVSLDGTQIFQTAALSFDQAYSLAGTAAGRHTLDVLAVDSQGNRRQVTYTVEVIDPASPFTYLPVAVLPVTAQLLDSDGTSVLYRLANYPGLDNRMFRQPETGPRVELVGTENLEFPIPAFVYDTYVWNPVWDLSGDRVSVAGLIGTTQAAFLYDASGAAQALPYPGGGSASRVNLFGSWAVWGDNQVWLRHLGASGADIGPIDLQSPGLQHGFTFAGAAGAERLIFPKNTGSNNYGLFYYDVASATTTQFTTGGGFHYRPQSDGTRIAWAHDSSTTPNVPTELLVAPFATPGPANTTTVSTTAVRFRLSDGVLAWVEPSANQQVLKIDDATGGLDVSTAPTIDLLASSGGNVLFVENDRLYVWSRAGGKRVLQPSTPVNVKVSGNVVFLLNGFFEGKTLYRVDL